MSESTGGCKFSFDQRDWEAENGTTQRWTAICERLNLDDGVWHCPHDSIVGSESRRCSIRTPTLSLEILMRTNDSGTRLLRRRRTQTGQRNSLGQRSMISASTLSNLAAQSISLEQQLQAHSVSRLLFLGNSMQIGPYFRGQFLSTAWLTM